MASCLPCFRPFSRTPEVRLASRTPRVCLASRLPCRIGGWCRRWAHAPDPAASSPSQCSSTAARHTQTLKRPQSLTAPSQLTHTPLAHSLALARAHALSRTLKQIFLQRLFRFRFSFRDASIQRRFRFRLRRCPHVRLRSNTEDAHHSPGNQRCFKQNVAPPTCISLTAEDSAGAI